MTIVVQENPEAEDRLPGGAGIPVGPVPGSNAYSVDLGIVGSCRNRWQLFRMAAYCHGSVYKSPYTSGAAENRILATFEVRAGQPAHFSSTNVRRVCFTIGRRRLSDLLGDHETQ